MNSALPLIALMVFLMLVLLAAGFAYAVYRAREELTMVRGLLTALARPLPDFGVQPCSRIPERRAMDPKAALDFYQRLHASPDWPVLAHKLQIDARQALLHCRTLVDDGKGEAALFHAGVAHYAAQLAVLPERELQIAVNLLKHQAAEEEITKQNGMQAHGSWRPARH